jgi:hypothetical protein
MVNSPDRNDHQLDPATSAELVRLVQAGRKIEAIKLMRERTGLGLAEAKSAVDAMSVGLTVKQPGCLGLLLLPLWLGVALMLL